jgi:pimeloyl-ACP methyl ester carboxylesterase
MPARGLRLLLATALLLAMAAPSMIALDDAAFELPAPTGTLPIGTTSWHVTDPSRAETFAAPGVRREVEVLAWYPAASATGNLAPYLRGGLFEIQSFAALLRGPKTIYDNVGAVRTHAHLDAPPAASPAKFPLLVFSHGYGGFASASTALLEDLASHGYVVLGIAHPYEVGAATLTDGRVVSFVDDETGAPRQGYLDVVGEWGAEDATMAAVTKTTDEDEQRKLLRAYLSTLRNTGAALRRWVDDTKLVLDRFPKMTRDSLGGQLAARVDANRAGILGHSMGGVTAGQFCVEDRRCVAGLNLDGIPQYGTMIDKPMKRPFLMVYSARPGRLGASDVIYRKAARYVRVDVQDTLHLDFSDMNFWGGPLRERGAFGPIAPARAAEITRAIVREYFDQMLLGRRSALLSGQSPFPEVSVKSR